MKWIKRICFIGLMSVSFHVAAIDLDIRIFSTTNITSVTVTPLSGNYHLLSDTVKIGDLYQSIPLELTVEKTKVRVKKNGVDVGLFESITLEGQGFLNTLTIAPSNPVKKDRVYDDGLRVSVSGGFLQIVNHVDIEHYVAGVVESEGGGKYATEFFKVQSVICRTYALHNIRKHLKDSGYNLCDDVHCQVYRGRCKSNPVMMATSQTVGEVIVDSDQRPISAAFHSNCGGQTMNSEDIWSVPTTYLKSRTDTFCLKKPNATWVKKIPKKEWIDYLVAKYQYSVKDTNMLAKALIFLQPVRKINFCEAPLIPLKNIRNDFKLKSTFFSLSCIGDTIIMKGRGFGHGVGLCQEGAMRMVELGWSYLKIVQYYYRDVKIINFEDIHLY